ncbi:MAG: hypothetical protein SF339_08980 [Blastocatellia bacterium]|nr:hypothetical protein [Blastocatellia bacterium]
MKSSPEEKERQRMVSTISLNQVEELIEKLSRQDRLLLIERLAHRLREEGTEFLSEHGARIMQQSLIDQMAMAAAWEKVKLEMEIGGEPVRAEELQRMFHECGIQPEENQFSRGIIEMREE